MKFRKKPIIIEAVHWLGEKISEPWFCEAEERKITRISGNMLVIGTLEGTMIARYGDWIIRGVKGELYPCKPEIFEATYEIVIEP